MTAAVTPVPVDTDGLPPTQCLVMEVLAARWRTGERMWTFPTAVKPAIRRLENLGLVGWQAGSAYRTVHVWLTDAGRAAVLSDTYEPPDWVEERRRLADRLLDRRDQTPRGRRAASRDYDDGYRMGVEDAGRIVRHTP